MQSGKYIVEVNDAGQAISEPVLYTGQAEPINEFYVPYVGLSYFFVGTAILVAVVFSSLYIVKQQTVKIIERLGKFKKVSGAGLSFKIPFIDRIVGKVDLRTQQYNVRAETKTKDNVFVGMNVAVQYSVPESKAFDAFYKLEDPQKQIASFVFDVVRSNVPKMTLDELFEKKENIASAVKLELTQVMDDFGYNILTALVTDIDPDGKVKASMNEINTQQRLRLAANEKGEAEKILVVKNAEAESESKKLQGEGIAQERQAIAEGLEKSVKMLEKAGIKGDEVLGILMLTQYLDMLKSVGSNSKSNVVYLNSSPEGFDAMRNEIIKAVKS